ncbi:hypothetical protein DFS34DRAFT_651996 [Phlyctochytrium arcticum]|nr:hypothetical protein DFS34DRAFT_651996 [Phlyctochytrium arcticum]
MAGSRLPAEILANIAGEIDDDLDDDDRETFLALSSVSHTWHQLAQPHLYRSITFRDSSRLPSQLQLLSRTVEEKPHLASFIRKLGFTSFHAKLFAEIASLASLCANLKRLDLRWGFRVQDPDLLGILEKCRPLEELRIASCEEITSKGFIKALPFLKNLRKLDLSGVWNLDDDCLCEIAKMCPLLEDLDLRWTAFTPTGLWSIMELATTLTSLNLSRNRINDWEIIAIMEGKPPHLTITVCDHVPPGASERVWR